MLNVLFRHPLMISALAGLLALALMEWFIAVEVDRQHQAEAAALQATAGSARARLESDLNATLFLSLGLSTMVVSDPDFTEEKFERVAESLLRLRPSIRSIALAPDNVIRHVYPRRGNEAALGLDYMETPAQRDAVVRLMQEQRPVVAGPIELVQGGTGIVNRVPILLPLPSGATRYWGLASVAINPLPIFRNAGVMPGESGTLEYALRGRDGLGARGEAFLGDAALFLDPGAVSMDIVIPGGTWQLAARMQQQPAWLVGRQVVLHLLAVVLSGGIAVMLGALLLAHRRIKTLALEDSLTGLANRHQFNLRAADLFTLAKRSGRPLTLLNMDLNGFKAINDSYGHDVGDAVLVHVARRLLGCLRESDVLARVGGDEFLALLPDTGSGPKLDRLMSRLHTAVAEPIQHLDSVLTVGISIGAATCHATTADLEALMREADRAMYAAKSRT
jgi:diguanylate cyclase (GGDEF)-like protein